MNTEMAEQVSRLRDAAEQVSRLRRTARAPQNVEPDTEPDTARMSNETPAAPQNVTRILPTRMWDEVTGLQDEVWILWEAYVSDGRSLVS